MALHGRKNSEIRHYFLQGEPRYFNVDVMNGATNAKNGPPKMMLGFIVRRLIAASHALHRFLAPRHPPFALSSLTTNFIAYFWRTLLGYTRESTYSVVKEPRGQSRDSPYRFSPGGDDRSRTGDPLLAKQVLSQLSYIPSSCISKAPILVGLPGVEPGTSRLSSARSSQLS